VHNEGIHQFAHNTKASFYEWMALDPQTLKDFNTWMEATMGGRAYWTDWYPIESRILEGANPKTKLLVDIGGGKGHDLQRFLNRVPDAKGLVLQDLPQAIQASTEEVLDPSAERMEYDFFTEQPVKGIPIHYSMK